MKTYLIDLDGTMYEGTNNIDGAIDFINYLKQTNQNYFFFTNNSTRTKKQNKEKMIQMGFEADDEDKFITSSSVLAHYLYKEHKCGSAFVIGKDGIKDELIQKGFTIVDNDEYIADFVVIALDNKADYKTYSKALRYLLNGSKFYATNMDRRYPTEKGCTLGNGSIVKMLEFASEKQAIKLGKPNEKVINIIQDMKNIKKEDIIIIGDNLETDILLGQNASINTILVETGLHKKEDCERLNIFPTLIVKNLKELIK